MRAPGCVEWERERHIGFPPYGFSHPPPRTGRASFNATGSRFDVLHIRIYTFQNHKPKIQNLLTLPSTPVRPTTCTRRRRVMVGGGIAPPTATSEPCMRVSPHTAPRPLATVIGTALPGGWRSGSAYAPRAGSRAGYCANPDPGGALPLYRPIGSAGRISHSVPAGVGGA